MTCWRRSRPGFPRAMPRPETRSRPWAGTTPLTAFRNVVFPLPFGPTRPRISPSTRSRLTPSTACTPPNATLMSSASSTGSPSTGGAADAVTTGRPVAARASSDGGASTSRPGPDVQPAREPRRTARVGHPRDPAAEAPTDPDETLGVGDHHDHEQRPEDDVLEVAGVVNLALQRQRELRPRDPEDAALQPLRDEDVEERPEDRAPARIDAAEDEHHEDADAEVDRERVGRRERLPVHEDRPRRTRDGGPEHEHRHAQTEDGDADGRRDRGLVAPRDRLALDRRPGAARSRGA